MPGSDDAVTVAGLGGPTADAVSVKDLSIGASAGLKCTSIDISRSLEVDTSVGIYGEVRLGPGAQGQWSGGVIDRIDVAAGATLTTLPGDVDLSNNGMNIEGTLVLSGNRLVLYDNGICNTGLAQVAAKTTIAGVAAFDNRSNIEFTASGVTLELDARGFVGSTGLFLRRGSTVDLGSGGLLWLRVSDSHSEAGARVVGDGRIRLSGHLAVDAGGIDVARTVTFELTEEGILYGEADLGAARVEITGGDVTDRLTIPPEGTVRVTGADGQYLHALRVRGTGTLTAGPLIRAADLTNEGTLTIDGAVRIGQSSSLTNHGTLTFAANASLDLDHCHLACDGKIDLADGGLLWLRNTDNTSRLDPPANVTGTGNIRLGSLLTVEGAVPLPNTVTFELTPGGILSGEADLGAARVEITGGDITDRLTIPPEGTVRVTGADGQYLHALRVRGTGTLTAGPLIRAADLTNEGTLTIDGAVRIGQSSSLTNHGTLTFAANASLDLDQCDLASDGVLDLGTHRLRVRSGAVRLASVIKATIPGTADTKSKGVTHNPIQFGRIIASSAVDITARLDVGDDAAKNLSPLLSFPIVQGGWLSGSVQAVPDRWRADCSDTTVMLRLADRLHMPIHSRVDPAWVHDSTLQMRVSNLIAAGAIPDPGPVAVVDLTDFVAPPAYAHSLGDKAVCVASIAKIAAMLAAYQLRADLRTFAGTFPVGDPDELFAAAADAWGITGTRAPRLAEIFFANGKSGSWVINFKTYNASPKVLDDLHTALDAHNPPTPDALAQLRKLAFADWMSLMIAWSDNAAATACIRQLGSECIIRVAQDLGLYDCGISGGLWLGGEYADVGSDFGPSVEVWPDPISGSTQASTALALAGFLTMLARDQLVDYKACSEMRAQLTRWGKVSVMTALAVGALGGTDVIVSGGDDKTVRIWNADGTPHGDPLTGHTNAVQRWPSARSAAPT